MSNGLKLERLCILPPMVIARFGSSPIPMEAYEVRIPVDGSGKPTTDYRSIVPAETFVIDAATGAITGAAPPPQVRFRDAQGRIKPVCPFLEVWAQFVGKDELVPLTLEHLEDLGVTPANLVWRVRAANLKVFRRTGDPRDKVEADTGPFSDHDVHALDGRSGNFKPGKSIPFGSIRVIRPTTAFPEVRLRFTPGKGHVFGPRAGDPLVTDDVYAGSTSGGLPPTTVPGRWDRYYNRDPFMPPVTAPADIFQGRDIGMRDQTAKLSSGYLDDTCDGIVEVVLAVGGQSFPAYARFAAAVPDFAPDSFPVRSIADDIEQMALGPGVTPPTDQAGLDALRDDVHDILRRALDTQRQMNVAALNGNEPVEDVAVFRNNMPGQQTSYNRTFEPIFPNPSYAGALGMHKAFLEAAINSASGDQAFTGGFAFVRQPEDIANLENTKRVLMPAMMRGNEGLELALTRRQIAKLALADPQAQAVQPLAAPAAAAAAPAADLRTANPYIPRRVRAPAEG